MAKEFIKVVGARQHNLKNLTLSIPRDKLVVVTGPSGSGKSSLAFDTIFAEGQRKYVESLSSYARQFLDQMQKPDIDYIEGLSPTIAIEQRTSGSSPRSIIATTTEIYDYLRLLFAHIGRPHCPVSGRPITRQTPTEITNAILSMPPRTRIMLLAPIVENTQGEFRDVIERLNREGFVRARIDGDLVELGGNSRIRLDVNKKHTIEVVVDRIMIDDKIRVRLADSVEIALNWGDDKLRVLSRRPDTNLAAPWTEQFFSTKLFSPDSGKSYEQPTPKYFSFNSPQGACTECHGLGQKLFFDSSLIIPNTEKSLEQGAVLPWKHATGKMAAYYRNLLKDLSTHYRQSLIAPFNTLDDEFKHILLHGSGKEKIKFHFQRSGKLQVTPRPFEGIIPNLERLYAETQSESTRNRLKAFMSYQKCDVCNGARLKPEILAVTIGPDQFPNGISDISGTACNINRASPKIPGLSIMDVCSLSIDKALRLFNSLTLTEFEQQIARELLREIRTRLDFLRKVGLGYLTLNRESNTLSGGEAQRIRLGTQIGAGLVGVVYILDEPSIGLHQRDNERLLQTLEELRNIGNSVIVVEHDEETISRADHIIDLGPAAGIRGGYIVAEGDIEHIKTNRRSLTGRYLSRALSIPVPRKRRAVSPSQGYLEIFGASENNLKNIDARIPLGTLTCVTGVSGSGKSTLVDDILKRALFRVFYGSKERPGAHRGIRGLDFIDKVVVIDQTPIGRTPRSNPATYTGMFNIIRDLFARLPSARIRGFNAGRFSFNVKGGRCEKCQGGGMIKLEMNFLPPVYVKCEACNGLRYNRETLEITYKGKNIADILAMTVDEAVVFFRAIPQILDICLTLAEVGLGYIALGQAATTLSGGEAQRIKLASELSKRSTGRTLFILDEPTTGLHFHDIAKLLDVLFKLRNAGNSLLVIEHNLDVIKNADWILDLGPEGGDDGGRVIAEGTPESVIQNQNSYTGRFLKQLLQKEQSPVAAAVPED
ncbi:MAG: excinuclease ABC subunit UvrA [Verrucomicrobia bacterium]|nr:excinuclease ABC subunit UvrA [Verrucomicrobiota bacterium]